MMIINYRTREDIRWIFSNCCAKHLHANFTDWWYNLHRWNNSNTPSRHWLPFWITRWRRSVRRRYWMKIRRFLFLGFRSRMLRSNIREINILVLRELNTFKFAYFFSSQDKSLHWYLSKPQQITLMIKMILIKKTPHSKSSWSPKWHKNWLIKLFWRVLSQNHHTSRLTVLKKNVSIFLGEKKLTTILRGVVFCEKLTTILCGVVLLWKRVDNHLLRRWPFVR